MEEQVEIKVSWSSWTRTDPRTEMWLSLCSAEAEDREQAPEAEDRHTRESEWHTAPCSSPIIHLLLMLVEKSFFIMII